MNNNKLTKLLILLRLLLRNPREFRDRLKVILSALVEVKSKYTWNIKSVSLHEALRQWNGVSKEKIAPILDEKPLLALTERVQQLAQKLKNDGPFPFEYSGDISLARFCYLIVRLFKPDVVVETGVAYGMTSAFILQAMAVNEKGKLWSIDLPPLGDESDAFVGVFIPDDLRPDWHFLRGPSERLLPEVLSKVQKMDIFIHDSLHTYKHMSDEFNLAWPFLVPGGVLISDDVHDNSAFQDFVLKVGSPYHCVVQEVNKNSAFGFLIKGTETS